MRRIHRRPFLLLALCAAAFISAAPQAARAAPAAERGRGITVFAAASMTDVLQELGARYQQETGTPVTLSPGASSTLARQIEAGARADVFVSADQGWMDYLSARQLIDTASRRDIAGNSLVLIAPADSTVQLPIAPGMPLAAALGDGRLAVADPDTVPAGRYAKAALTQLGVWDSVAGRLANADNVRAALAFVARGETPLGIVYSTDARIEKRVRVVGVFPEGTHAPITYPAALPREAGPGGAAFLAWLMTAESQATFARYGFTAPGSVIAPVAPAAADPCVSDIWKIEHEVAVMSTPPVALDAATDAGAPLPELAPDTAYQLVLGPQSAVRFAYAPERAAQAAQATAGLVQLRVATAGRYRISLSSAHWVDVLDGGRPLTALSFHGHQGCAALRKIVEFELPADRPLVLQLSKASVRSVRVAVTPQDVKKAP